MTHYLMVMEVITEMEMMDVPSGYEYEDLLVVIYRCKYEDDKSFLNSILLAGPS